MLVHSSKQALHKCSACLIGLGDDVDDEATHTFRTAPRKSAVPDPSRNIGKIPEFKMVNLS